MIEWFKRKYWGIFVRLLSVAHEHMLRYGESQFDVTQRDGCSPFFKYRLKVGKSSFAYAIRLDNVLDTIESRTNLIFEEKEKPSQLKEWIKEDGDLDTHSPVPVKGEWGK